MESAPVLLETYHIINKDFKIEKEQTDTDTIISNGISLIRTALSERIRLLMNNEYEKLLQILFRIDVNEIKLKKAFKENMFDDMPPIIADLVIERQIIKARLRTSTQENMNAGKE